MPVRRFLVEAADVNQPLLFEMRCDQLHAQRHCIFRAEAYRHRERRHAQMGEWQIEYRRARSANACGRGAQRARCHQNIGLAERLGKRNPVVIAHRLRLQILIGGDLETLRDKGLQRRIEQLATGLESFRVVAGHFRLHGHVLGLGRFGQAARRLDGDHAYTRAAQVGQGFHHGGQACVFGSGEVGIFQNAQRVVTLAADVQRLVGQVARGFIARVRAGQGVEDQGRVFDAMGERAHMVEAAAAGVDAGLADAAEGSLEGGDAIEGRGAGDRACGLRAQREQGHACAHGGGGATAGAARRVARVPGVGGGRRVAQVGELGGGGLAQQDGVLGFEGLDDRGVLVGDMALEHFGAGFGADSCGADDVLGPIGDAKQQRQLLHSGDLLVQGPGLHLGFVEAQQLPCLHLRLGGLDILDVFIEKFRGADAFCLKKRPGGRERAG